MPSTDLLLRENEILNQLYDADSIMSIQKSVAEGYIALLGGMKENNADLALSFSTLTQGNVVDACFGVVDASIRREETPASKSAKAAKSLLQECAERSTDDQFEKLAVSAYCQGFQELIVFQTKMGKLNCIVRCVCPWKAKKIRKKTEKQLRVTFLELAKAISEQR